MPSQRQLFIAPAAMNNTDDIATSIASYLDSKNVRPTAAWMQSFMPTIRVGTPMVALQKTALFRLLAADLTTSVRNAAVFPANIGEPTITETSLRGPFTVQLLDIEDIGRSRWSQVEAIEAQERGETTKGREVIRVLPDDNNAPPDGTHAPGHANNNRNSGPHKLLLQDAKGTEVYAVELEAINGISTSMSIGSKLVLRQILVARGLLLLQRNNVEVLGGKVEAWDKQWRGDKKDVLKEKASVRETE